MRRIVEILSGVAVGAAIIAAAWVVMTPPLQSPFDANGDDRIGYTEFRAFAASIFEQVDTNADGMIDQPERKAASRRFRPSLAQAITAMLRLRQLDSDGDGRISKAEFLGGSSLKVTFKQLDKDSDGFLARGERGDLAFKLLFP